MNLPYGGPSFSVIAQMIRVMVVHLYHSVFAPIAPQPNLRQYMKKCLASDD